MRSLARVRLPAARVLMAGLGVSTLASALMHHAGATEIAWGALTASTAWLMGRPSARAQILSRGIAWANVLPTLMVFGVGIGHGITPGVTSIASAATALAALGLSLPALQTREAREAFAPSAYRPWLLAAAVASLGIGLESARLGAAFLRHGGMLPFLMLSIALTLVASGIGVARMRAWGVLVGFLSPLFAVAISSMLFGELRWIALFGALPALMMGGVLAAARRSRGDGSQIRVAEVSRLRVAHATDHAADSLDECGEEAGLLSSRSC